MHIHKLIQLSRQRNKIVIVRNKDAREPKHLTFLVSPHWVNHFQHEAIIISNLWYRRLIISVHNLMSYSCTVGSKRHLKYGRDGEHTRTI